MKSLLLVVVAVLGLISCNANYADQTAQTEPVEQAVNTPPPTDQQEVLAQLKDLENEWTTANLNGDKQKLQRILAIDYVGPATGGGLQGKIEYIRDADRDTGVQNWQLDNLNVQLAGDHATLTGNITYNTRDRQFIYDFKDKFVWRNGRWQATGSELTPKN